ncbi:response regulator transcription factor [Alcaligenes faecalis]|jgi:DNA-binding response OmpR family regulator|uniref:Response regulator transcription factor n=1 Tax=Alcaligenes faecalis TaxID=511 RepID=A0ABY7MY29_ALCFA|nr:response regulator transcription factor [Alcaligenes faecalis]WBM36716.1 response regulator transcription factor [Alcaligenes faecalis]
MRVLIVENDTTIAENLYTYLELKGFAVDAAYDGNGALALLQDQDFDALVLDLGLPGLDGFGVLQALRQSRQTPIPTLVLTARSQLESKLTAFDLGADDYLIKPFALAEVEARLRALMRRGPPQVQHGSLHWGGLEYNLDSALVQVHGQALHLSFKARQLLEAFLRDPQAILTRRALEKTLWPQGAPSPEALRSQIHLLRRALSEAGAGTIETLPGMGWRLQAEH